jgi:hypothetical protein
MRARSDAGIAAPPMIVTSHMVRRRGAARRTYARDVRSPHRKLVEGATSAIRADGDQRPSYATPAPWHA